MIEMVFGDDIIGRDVEMPKHTLAILMLITTTIGLISCGFLFFLLVSTIWGDTRGTIKKSEKFLLYNVIAPDAVLAVFILAIVCPATYTNKWPYSSFITNWLGYIFLWSVFHASLAMASICNLIAMSYRQATRYDLINKKSTLFLLSASYASVSFCLCSLPATERSGFMFSHFWFQPTATVYKGFGGIFSIAANTGLSLVIIGVSLRHLFNARSEIGDQKVTKRYRGDLNSCINFAGLSFTMAFLLPFPMMIPIDHHVIAFALRCVVYVGPILRVLLLTRTCPYFHFVSYDGMDQDLLSEFAQLGAAG